ncbi:hypothetical protein CYMTET_33316, partial [Cymbomonas tetramitiformis]
DLGVFLNNRKHRKLNRDWPALEHVVDMLMQPAKAELRQKRLDVSAARRMSLSSTRKLGATCKLEVLSVSENIRAAMRDLRKAGNLRLSSTQVITDAQMATALQVMCEQLRPESTLQEQARSGTSSPEYIVGHIAVCIAARLEHTQQAATPADSLSPRKQLQKSLSGVHAAIQVQHVHLARASERIIQLMSRRAGLKTGVPLWVTELADSWGGGMARPEWHARRDVGAVGRDGMLGPRVLSGAPHEQKGLD